MTAREGAHRPFALAAGLLILTGIALRYPAFGDPFYTLDESFYLYAGDRLLAGELPYVDLWDRKPIGLFLIYAAIRALGGDGFLQYQLVAAGFAIATALAVMRIAARRCGMLGATTAGLLYLVFLQPLGGGGGQSPVFYNLPMALAALLTLKAAESADPQRIGRLGLAACLLCGLAIQIKYTAAFESALFGLVLLGFVRAAGNGVQMLKWGSAFLLAGLAPTLGAFGLYLALGQGDAFLFANFISILRRGSPETAESLRRIAVICAVLGPLAAAAAAGAWLERDRDRRAALPMLGWPIATAAGIALVGNFYDHYALPLLAPLAVLAAAFFDKRPIGPAAAACAALWALTVRDYPGPPVSRTQAEMSRLRHLVDVNLRGGCLFILEGPPSLYHLTRACRVTRYAFPGHLVAEVEADAIGVDQTAELRRILAARPTVIVTQQDMAVPNYRLAGIGRLRGRDYRIYALNPLNRGSASGRRPLLGPARVRRR